VKLDNESNYTRRIQERMSKLNDLCNCFGKLLNTIPNDPVGFVLVVKGARTCHTRTFRSPTSLRLGPIVQANVQNSIAKGPDIHFQDNLVLEFPPSVIINWYSAGTAGCVATRNKWGLVKTLSQPAIHGYMSVRCRSANIRSLTLRVSIGVDQGSSRVP
jgi:hypothetical protein